MLGRSRGAAGTVLGRGSSDVLVRSRVMSHVFSLLFLLLIGIQSDLLMFAIIKSRGKSMEEDTCIWALECRTLNL